MLIINYEIIKSKYKLNLNINEKSLIILIFKRKKYIILKILLLLPLSIRNISRSLLLSILSQLKIIEQKLQIIFKLKLKVIID